MILAAGEGRRMRPLSLGTPKPLLKVGGRAMLDWALDKVAAAGVKRAVVNAFYLAGQIEAHGAARRDIEIIISREDQLLDTGGGIKHALSHFDKPFFALNADLPWTEGAVPALRRMADFWDAGKMDVLLLLMTREKARGFVKGDFALAPDGRAHRRDEAVLLQVMLAAQIVKPDLYQAVPELVFSNNRVWDAAEAAGRLYGIEHDGGAYHVGTPADLAEANRLIESGEGWRL